MYTVISAYGVESKPVAQWASFDDVQLLTGQQLAARFRVLYIEVNRDGTGTNFNINLFGQAPSIAQRPETLEEVLAAWDEGLLTPEERPAYTAKAAQYTDALKAGFSIQAATTGGTPDSSNDINDLTELQLGRNLTDMRFMHERVLMNVNGMFYRSEFAGNKLLIPHAAKSLRYTDESLVGFLSFEAIGKVETVAITTASLMRATPDVPMKEGIFLKAPAQAAGKSLLLVIGGYLHFMDWMGIETISDDTYFINPQSLRLAQRYAESYKYLDLSHQNASGSESSLQVDPEYLLSDESLTAHLTMPQSFWVVVDTPRLKSVSSSLHSMRLPGRFFSYKDPTALMLTGAGKANNYWKVHEDGIWGMHIPAGHAVPSVDSLATPKSAASLSFRWTEPYKNPPATMVEIIADQVAT